jgi:hypothetical protein
MQKKKSVQTSKFSTYIEVNKSKKNKLPSQVAYFQPITKNTKTCILLTNLKQN